jgi:hypothetical protein
MGWLAEGGGWLRYRQPGFRGGRSGWPRLADCRYPWSGGRPVRHGPDSGCPAVSHGLPGLGGGDVGGRVADGQHGITGIRLRPLLAPVVAGTGCRPGALGPGRLPACTGRPASRVRVSAPGRVPGAVPAVPRGELARRVHGRRLTGDWRIAADWPLAGRTIGGRSVPAAPRAGRAVEFRARGVRRPLTGGLLRSFGPVAPTGEPGVCSVVGRGGHEAERIRSAGQRPARRGSWPAGCGSSRPAAGLAGLGLQGPVGRSARAGKPAGPGPGSASL